MYRDFHIHYMCMYSQERAIGGCNPPPLMHFTTDILSRNEGSVNEQLAKKFGQTINLVG